ncbi:MAG: hypothetical protein ACLP9Y_05250 [Mycobacterium sp.]
MRRQPPTEYASGPVHAAGFDGWRSLSQQTGLPIERIAELGMAKQLRSLFDANGLLPGEELRALDRAGRLGQPVETRSLHLRLIEHLGRRWPAEPQTAQQLLIELYRQRGEWT